MLELWDVRIASIGSMLFVQHDGVIWLLHETHLESIEERWARCAAGWRGRADRRRLAEAAAEPPVEELRQCRDCGESFKAMSGQRGRPRVRCEACHAAMIELAQRRAARRG